MAIGNIGANAKAESAIAANRNKFSNFETKLHAKNEMSDKEMKDICFDFEAILVKMMLDAMRKTVKKENLMGEGGNGQEIFEDMLYDERSKTMARSANFGVADMLYSQMTRAQNGSAININS